MSTEKAESIVTKDRWEILTLLTFGFIPQDVQNIEVHGKMVRVFIFGEDARQTWLDYRFGRALPLDDIRKVVKADEIFKGFIRI